MPETSENFSIGVTGSLGDLDFTLDYFSIDVADYFSAISTLDVSTDPDSGDAYANYLALDAAGVSGANSIGGVFYFTNAYMTASIRMGILLRLIPLNGLAARLPSFR